MRNLFHKRASLFQPGGQETSPLVIRDLEKTIDPQDHLPGQNKCQCHLCLSGQFAACRADKNLFRSDSREASRWFKRLLEGLTVSGAKTLKLFLPDILFVDGESLEIFQTSRKDGRVVKLAGLTPLKLVLPTFLRMRREYKSLLEQNYNQQMLDKINPEFMHLKYFEKLVPAHFHAGNDSATLDSNKRHFRRYVLHTDPKYQIQQIEEHKMNEKEPFCIIKFNDGNCQLLNQTEFEALALPPAPKLHDACFFQSYIKYKQEAESIYYSEYTYGALLDAALDRQAEKEVMVLLGAVNRYDEDYRDIETLEELSVDLMLASPSEYVQFMTHKIVHFLAMASRVYLMHLKVKWILNDIGTVYLQEILEWETSELPHRLVKYRLPLKDDALDFYNSNNFVDIYRDMRRRKAINTLIIRKDLDAKTYEEILDIMDPLANQPEPQQPDPPAQPPRLPQVRRKSKLGSQTSRTIDASNRPSLSPDLATLQPRRSRFHNFSTYEEHLRQHPEVAMKNRRYDSNSLGRYSEAPQKIERVDRKINNHFVFNMSSEDYKTFGSPELPKPSRALLEEYLDKRRARVEQSVLYSTFHQLNSQRLRQLNATIEGEKIRRPRGQSSIEAG